MQFTLIFPFPYLSLLSPSASLRSLSVHYAPLSYIRIFSSYLSSLFSFPSFALSNHFPFRSSSYPTPLHPSPLCTPPLSLLFSSFSYSSPLFSSLFSTLSPLPSPSLCLPSSLIPYNPLLALSLFPLPLFLSFLAPGVITAK